MEDAVLLLRFGVSGLRVRSFLVPLSDVDESPVREGGCAVSAVFA